MPPKNNSKQSGKSLNNELEIMLYDKRFNRVYGAMQLRYRYCFYVSLKIKCFVLHIKLKSDKESNLVNILVNA